MGAIAACSSSSPGQKPADGGGADGPTIMPFAAAPLGTATEIPQTAYKFISLEGPYWVASGNYLLFSDVVEKNAMGALIYKYDPATNMFSIYPYPTMAPASTNGLGMDSMGRLVATERVNHRVTRVEGAMLKELVAAVGGKNLDAPNDVVVDSKDNIYFTDTHWGSAYPDPMLIPTGAYRIAALDGAVTKLWEGGPDPLKNSINGIALSKDEKTLYLGDDTANQILSIPLTDGLVPAGTMSKVFASKTSVPGGVGLQVPDGINVDDDGKVYVSINHHDTNCIAVFGADGSYVGRYDVPVGIDKDPVTGLPADPGGKGPSNITFGGADRKTMYITTLHAIYKVTALTAGKP
ncbi:MAG TPA: SMP-30/gluconolactonase/LRE family protein [Polyangia bacterium]|nr:SMP-30/gluconolactonase/LRE family protein [Polyangia bacterium]